MAGNTAVYRQKWCWKSQEFYFLISSKRRVFYTGQSLSTYGINVSTNNDTFLPTRAHLFNKATPFDSDTPHGPSIQIHTCSNTVSGLLIFNSYSNSLPTLSRKKGREGYKSDTFFSEVTHFRHPDSFLEEQLWVTQNYSSVLCDQRWGSLKNSSCWNVPPW